MTQYGPDSDRIHWYGRIVQDNSGNRVLVSSASGLKFRFGGNKCTIRLKNEVPAGNYNYFSIVLDGIHQQRIAIHADTFIPLEIKSLKSAPFHEVELYKETEALIGRIVINKIEADSLIAYSEDRRKKSNSSAIPSLLACLMIHLLCLAIKEHGLINIMRMIHMVRAQREHWILNI